MSKRETIWVLVPLLLFAVSGSVCAQFYQWTDSNGKVHYSDQMPPEKAVQGHNILTKDGLTIESITRQKTAEEIRKEQELARQQAARERIRLERQAKDDALRTTFSSVEHLNRVEGDRISLIDSQIAQSKRKVQKIQENYNKVNAQKSELLAQNKAVPKHLESHLSRLEDQIKTHQYLIQFHEDKKLRTKEKFAQDRERFIQLKSSK